ncbi:hypothetical protein SDRG_06394 [Saprolegnia diclina VS20]|uniref:Low temperature requirement protein LtrA n=1 Tax=Saprolegnia diclina (strain VS20) TaxID=1156394 RepID=T0QEF5_SAPDV|nr:hypothetical protein SDRG_06394 [Saprolegnia diclina VS20]EQC36289.1 hypothetical protein SDRG_06394 [Saprolegnia diclina VS20]|eukprot:XP_008610395.1 hypothetical protein SDRG_06394 [Saprolegnia diclina VS20]
MLRTFYGRATLSADWSGEYEEKSAGWFELFLDLIMVAACSNVAEGLKEDVSVHGLLLLGAMSLVYVSVWHMYTLFNARYSETSLLHYLFLYVLLVGLGTMVLSSTPSPTFTVGLIVLRSSIVLMKLSVYGCLPRARSKLRVDIVLQLLSIALLLASLYLPPSFTLPAYFLGFVLEWVMQFASAIWLSFRTVHVPLNIDHMNEREGCLVMVTLGESVVSAVINSRDLELTPRFYVAMQLSLFVILSLAIYYFSLQPPRELHALRRSYVTGFVFTYVHFALVPTLLVVGVGTKLVSAAVLANALLAPTSVWLFFGAISAAMALMLVLRVLHFGGRQPEATDPPCVKRIKYAWWGIFVAWPFLLLVCAYVLTWQGPVDPITALSVAVACVVVWLVSETAIMHLLAATGYGNIDHLLAENGPLLSKQDSTL